MYHSLYWIRFALEITAPPGPIKFDTEKLTLVSPPLGAWIAT